MKQIKAKSNLFTTGVLGAFVALSLLFTQGLSAHENTDKVYELRTYYTHEGKLDDLQARFRNHTQGIFERLGMKVVAYWLPTHQPAADNTLIYIIEHDSEDDAKQKWATFVKDPEWEKAYKASKVNGDLVKSIDVVFMRKTDFTPKH